MTNQTNRIRKARPITIFLILILIFVIPFSIAWMMFKGHHFFGLLNRGKLVKPPFSVSLLKLKNPRGKPLSNQLVNPKKQWMLVYFNPGLCEKPCQKALAALRLIQKATGKDMERVGRALLTYPSSLANNTSLNLVLSERFPGTRHLTAQETQFTNVIRQHVKSKYALESGTVYVVDPRGNVIMTYEPGTDPDDIYKDLKRLLKVSQIG